MPVRVTHVVLSLNPGGTERLIVDLVRRLGGQVQSNICCLDEVGTWGQQLRDDGFPVASLGRAPGFHPQLGRAIADLARQHNSAIIHAHQYTPFVYTCAAKPWLGGRPIIFTEHGRLSDAPASPKRRLANLVLRRIPAKTFAVSQDLKEFMVTEGFSEAQIKVIYNGIRVTNLPSQEDRRSTRASLGIDDDTWLVGTIARLNPVKNLAVLLKAVAIASSRFKIEAVVVGDGEERATLSRLAAELGIESKVHFLGHREDARYWLAGCDTYVNSSNSEGVSLTILEAMSAGMPVIATQVGGTPEVVTSDCGVLIPPRDPQALAGAIGTLVRNPAGARNMGLSGRARVEDLFTIERMVQDYATVYSDLSSGRL